MSDGVQGIHDGNGQVCRFPEAGEADGMSLAGPQEADSTSVSVATRQPVFIEGIKFLKHCGVASYNPKTHYCMDGAVLKHIDPKVIAELKHQKEEARQRELAWRQSLPAGAVICGPNESVADCSERAGRRPGADHFGYDDLPTLGKVVVGAGYAVLAVEGVVVAVVTAPVWVPAATASAPVTVPLAAGAAALACATEQEPIDHVPPVDHPTPGQAGDAYANVPEASVPEKEKDLNCLPPSYSFELVLKITGGKEKGKEPAVEKTVDGCSHIVIDEVAGSKHGYDIQLTGAGRWVNGLQQGVSGLEAAAFWCLDSGSPLGECVPYYNDIYPKLAPWIGLTAVVSGEVKHLGGKCDVSLNLVSTSVKLQTAQKEGWAPKEGLPTVFMTPYLSDTTGDICSVKPDLSNFWSIPLMGGLSLSFSYAELDWASVNPQHAIPNEALKVTICGGDKPSCKTSDGTSLKQLEVQVVIKPLGTQAPVPDADAGDAGPKGTDADAGSYPETDAGGADGAHIPPVDNPFDADAGSTD